MLPPDIQTEYSALAAGCGVAALPRTLIEVMGKDRVQLLNSFCTNDVKRLAAGQGCEAYVTNHQGKILSHVFIYCEPTRLVIDTVAGQAPALIGHFDRFVISEDVRFRDLSSEIGNLIVAGPRAQEILGGLCDCQLPAEPSSSAAVSIGGSPAMLRRVECAGNDCFFVQAANENLDAIRSAIQRAGAFACSEQAIEIVRVEAGFPLFGHDISEDNLPQEVGRDAQAISFKKGCYLGQETVARIDALGHVNKLLCQVKLSGEAVPNAGTTLVVGGKEVGRVTSAVWSPRLESALALAYVRRMHANAGTRLESEAGPAEIVNLPAASI